MVTVYQFYFISVLTNENILTYFKKTHYYLPLELNHQLLTPTPGPRGLHSSSFLVSVFFFLSHFFIEMFYLCWGEVT